MPVAPPAPIPQLDSNPPAAAGVQAQPAPVSMQGLAPNASQESVGSLQEVQLVFQTTQAVMQGLDILGQINPSLSALVATIQTQLREGVRKSLQQGTPGSEPSGPTFASMGGGV